MDKPFPPTTFVEIKVAEVIPDKTDANKISIKDTTGKKYKFKRFKKDGSETKAWAVWKDIVVNPGDILKIGYYNDVGNFKNEKGESIDYDVNRLTYLEQLEDTVMINADPNAGKVPTITHDNIIEVDDSIPF